MPGQHRVAQRQHIGFPRYVGYVHAGTFADGGRRLVQRRLRASGQDERRAMPCKAFGHAAADAATGAGDDADLSGQVELAHQFGPCRAMRCASDQRCTSDGPS